MSNVFLAVLVSMFIVAPAQAGFKFYGANGQTMNSTETEEERADRVARETRHVNIVNDWYRSLPPLSPASPPRKDRKNPVSVKDVDDEWKPKLDGGPAPGGHRRHEWRERTGFSTPAERTRYRRAIWEEKERLRKEKAKPNPAGDHPEKIRKQHMPKF